jgi:Tfp pilus assembly protein PilE/TM2 domain-containing membrane protein YozV
MNMNMDGGAVLKGLKAAATRLRDAFEEKKPLKPLKPLFEKKLLPQSSLADCPVCHHAVSTAALACPSCGHPLRVAPAGRLWSPGVAALLSLIIPGAGQIYKGQILNGLLWLSVVYTGYAFALVGSVFTFGISLIGLLPPLIFLHLCCIVGAAIGDPTKAQSSFSGVRAVGGLAIIGILAAIAIPKYENTRARAYISEMKWDLRNLVTAEEAFFAQSMRYSDNIRCATPGAVNFCATQGNTVVVSLSGSGSGGGWSATVTSNKIPVTCAIFVNQTAVAPATTEGAPACAMNDQLRNMRGTGTQTAQPTNKSSSSMSWQPRSVIYNGHWAGWVAALTHDISLVYVPSGGTRAWSIVVTPPAPWKLDTTSMVVELGTEQHSIPRDGDGYTVSEEFVRALAAASSWHIFLPVQGGQWINLESGKLPSAQATAPQHAAAAILALSQKRP